MACPKTRVSGSRRGKRRSQQIFKPLHLVACAHCSAHRLPHSVCETCGFYKGRFLAKRFLQTDLAHWSRKFKTG